MMKTRYLFLFFLTGVVVFSLSCENRGVLVHIRNNSKNRIEMVTIRFTGGKYSLLELPSGEETKIRVNPLGESALTINYKLNRKHYNHQLDVYIEPNYTGNLFIRIEDNGTINFESDIKISIYDLRKYLSPFDQ